MARGDEPPVLQNLGSVGESENRSATASAFGSPIGVLRTDVAGGTSSPAAFSMSAAMVTSAESATTTANLNPTAATVDPQAASSSAQLGTNTPSVNTEASSGSVEAPSRSTKGSSGDVAALQREGSSGVAKLEGGEVVFTMENVGIHPSSSASERIRGRLRLVKQHPTVYLSWTPYTLAEHPRGLDPKSRSQQYTIRAVALSEIRSVRRRTPQLGWQYVIFVLNTGLAFPPLYFYDGGVRAFIAALKQHATLIKSQDEPGVYLVSDSEDPLMGLPHMQQSAGFASLAGLPGPGRAEGQGPVSQQHARQWGAKQTPADNAKEVPLQVLQGFAGITRLARMALGVGSVERSGERILGGTDAEERMPMREGDSSKHQQQQGPRNQTASATQSEGGKQQSENLAVAHSELGMFVLVDPLEEVLAATKTPDSDRGPPLSHEEWVTYLDAEGRVTNAPEVVAKIFKRGLDPELRREVWKFLLGYFSFDSTYTERRSLDEAKIEEYAIYKQQWQSVTPPQARRFAKFRERVSRIDKDVVRTDRRLPQFSDDNSPNLVTLRSILLSYSFYNFDLGFCQGMSDLASPFLVLMEDECEAFWCFSQFMESMGRNFNRDQTGMHSQLLSLSKLLRLLDPPLFQYLESVDASNFFFCFRWLLIMFKREWEFEDVMKLWERIWTCPMTKHFHLYVCCAILKRFRRKIIDEQMQFEALVRFANELSCRLDLDDILDYAEALCRWAGPRGEACMPLPVEESATHTEGPESVD